MSVIANQSFFDLYCTLPVLVRKASFFCYRAHLGSPSCSWIGLNDILCGLFITFLAFLVVLRSGSVCRGRRYLPLFYFPVIWVLLARATGNEYRGWRYSVVVFSTTSPVVWMSRLSVFCSCYLRVVCYAMFRLWFRTLQFGLIFVYCIFQILY